MLKKILMFVFVFVFSGLATAQYSGFGEGAGDYYRPACLKFTIKEYGDGPWILVSNPKRIGVWIYSEGRDVRNPIPKKCDGNKDEYPNFRPLDHVQELFGTTYKVATIGIWIQYEKPVTVKK